MGPPCPDCGALTDWHRPYCTAPGKRPRTLAERIVDELADDARDTKGLKHAWSDLGDEAQQTVRERWRRAVEHLLAGGRARGER